MVDTAKASSLNNNGIESILSTKAKVTKMNMNTMLILVLFLTLPACSLVSDKFNMDTGLDGCVEYTMVNFSAGPVRADKVTYHRVNDKCKDIVVHPIPGGS
jgi:hypothetical protein